MFKMIMKIIKRWFDYSQYSIIIGHWKSINGELYKQSAFKFIFLTMFNDTMLHANVLRKSALKIVIN